MSDKRIHCRNSRFKEKINVGARLVRNFEGEALFNFGEYQDTKFAFVYGVGLILAINHSEKFDTIWVNFGRRKRRIIVDMNHARRQVYTLKVGQYAHIIAIYRRYKHFNEETQTWESEYLMFARALQGWYVPKQFDIEKGNDNFRDMTEEETIEINNILDNLEVTE